MSYSLATSIRWKPISRPVSSVHAARRTPSGRIGVSDSASSSTSALRRAKLSAITTS